MATQHLLVSTFGNGGGGVRRAALFSALRLRLPGHRNATGKLEGLSTPICNAVPPGSSRSSYARPADESPKVVEGSESLSASHALLRRCLSGVISIPEKK